MSDPIERAMRRAICEADPDDDEPRLVYADYLQERGDPRGELIAVQCREAQHPGDALARRALGLFDADEARWLGAWQGDALAWRFQRGFLYHLAIPVDAFVVLGELLLAHDPFPEELVHLGSLALHPPRGPGEPAVPALVALIARLRLRTLSLELAVGDRLAGELAASRALAHLTTLRLADATHAGDVPAILLRAPMERLAALALVNCHVTDDEALAIARAPRLRQVRRLDLSTEHGARAHYNELTAAGVVALVRANPALTALELRANLTLLRRGGALHYTSGDTTVLAALADLRVPLVELGLGNTRITSIAPLAALPTLERLDLRGNWLDDHALDTLLALPRLTTLNLAHTRVSAAGAARLVADAPPSLRELTLTVPRLPAPLVAALAARFELHRWA